MVFDVYINSISASLHSIVPGLAAVARWFSMFGAPLILGTIGMLAAYWYLVHRPHRAGIVWAWSIGIAGIIVLGLKPLFSRIRPDNALLILTDSSFPSGHALMAATFFVVLGYFWIHRLRRHKKSICLALFTCIIVPLIIGLSRLILNVHWATDVIAGWVIGVMVGFLVILFSKIHNR